MDMALDLEQQYRIYLLQCLKKAVEVKKGSAIFIGTPRLPRTLFHSWRLSRHDQR
jgi:hypothetical protein